MKPSLISPPTLGILMMLAAYLLFTFADSTNKWLVLTGLPILQLAFLRYGIQSVICTIETGSRGIRPGEIRANAGLLLLRGLVLCSATAANFYALKYLSLSMMAAIMFSAPIFVSLLSWPILGERVGPWRWAAIAFGFIGVLIIVRPFHSSFHPAALAGLLGAISVALYSLLTRKLAHRVRPHVMQLFSSTLGVVLFFPFALWLWQPLGEGWTIGLIVWVGVTSWAGHELLTRAHKLAEASMLMPYSYSFIIYMTLAGYLLYNELPSVFTVIGALVIVVSGLVIWYRESRVKRRALA
ncbi:MAG: DMT family transporter [Thiolinea sp.]